MIFEQLLEIMEAFANQSIDMKELTLFDFTKCIMHGRKLKDNFSTPLFLVIFRFHLLLAQNDVTASYFIVICIQFIVMNMSML